MGVLEQAWAFLTEPGTARCLPGLAAAWPSSSAAPEPSSTRADVAEVVRELLDERRAAAAKA